MTGPYMSVPETLARKYSGCLHTLGALIGLELYFLSFGQGFEPLAFDGREVDEHIRRAVAGCDKTKTFRLIEPFYSTSLHKRNLFLR